MEKQSNQSQEGNNIYIGLDVGLRRTFNFSNGLKFYLRANDFMKSHEELEKSFDIFMKRYFNDDKYRFFVEDFLLETSMKMPNKFGKNKRFLNRMENKNNHLVDYFLKKYKDKIEFVSSVNSSRECSNCGFISHENISNLCGFAKNKKFKCIFCCEELDRDLNASKVILKRGLKKNGEKIGNL